MLLSMYKGIISSSSSAIIFHSHERQNSLRSTLSKDTTLNTKEPIFIFTKQYGFPIVPFNSLTLWGITQAAPNNWKNALHNFVVTSQWRRRWWIDSSHFLHIQHHSTTITFFFRKLSKLQIFPKAPVHTKNAILEVALTFQILFQEKWELTGVGNTW
jgi:hypothetical protein